MNFILALDNPYRVDVLLNRKLSKPILIQVNDTHPVLFMTNERAFKLPYRTKEMWYNG